MKKILLSIALGVATIASSSATVITNPDLSLWSDDFSNGISDEWTMYSAGKQLLLK